MASHPYYPQSLIISHYAAYPYDLTQLLTVFFGVVAIVLVASIVIISIARPTSNLGYRLAFVWFVGTASVHLFVEGYVAYFHKDIAGMDTFMANIWKEYALSDSRYLVSDPFVIIMETITAFAWGPLCYVIAFLYLIRSPLRHPLLILVGTGQVYGDVLYYWTTFFEGKGSALSCHPHPYYFWFYFVFLNSIWIVVPSILIANSFRVIVSGLSQIDAADKKKKSK
ncbi:EBP domain-containing protein [Polychytrium aggregatum]|uniref:EBP domain-containing protein n=1 Tax=Polychytrium aggregatum TaxID=110093 RepID=UPI0022FDF986|nr:EBP domain-containing protein [Polychytrium aggregatum]KAI9193727.1 EBP domain-containing protein [Polychytrium aggregatum]